MTRFCALLTAATVVVGPAIGPVFGGYLAVPDGTPPEGGWPERAATHPRSCFFART